LRDFARTSKYEHARPRCDGHCSRTPNSRSAFEGALDFALAGDFGFERFQLRAQRLDLLVEDANGPPLSSTSAAVGFDRR
jgi:hypothetical protein